jgi:hypothetical protein
MRSSICERLQPLPDTFEKRVNCFLCAACSLVVALGADIALGTPLHRLLPTNTRTVAIVNNYADAWRIYRGKETGRGGTTGSVEGRVDASSTKFGLTPDELAAHVTGPVMRAELRTHDGRPAELLVALIDDPSELLAAAGRRLAKRSAKVRGGAFNPARSRVYSWIDSHGVDRVSVHVWHQGHLILTDNERAAHQVIALMVAQTPSGLATQEAFAVIWDQVGWSEAQDCVTLFWYAQPWLHEQKSLRLGEKTAPQNDNYLFAQRHGLTGIRAIGGRARVSANGAAQAEAVAYAPRPLQKSLKIFAPLEGAASWRLPDWIGASTGNVVILHGNIPESLRHISCVFDDAFAQGVKGTYDQVLEDLKAEDGLGIDVIKELYSFLGPRAYLVWGDRAGRGFRPFMIAFETTDAAKVSSAIDALIRDDPEARPIRLGNAAATLWNVAGENGGEDFTLGVVQGFAVYSNDLRLVRHMLSANRGQRLNNEQLFTRDVLPLLRNGLQHPFLLALLGPHGRNARTNGERAAGARFTALDLMFQGPDRIWPTNRAWQNLESVLRNLAPFGESYRVVVGFVEPYGWRFSMHQRRPDPQKE